MRITYVTEDTEIWGGIGIVFQHLELLAEMGHDVFLTTLTSAPDWYSLKVPVYTVKEIDPSLIPDADIVVIASWRIAREVVESHKGTPVYLCQAYEALFKEYAFFIPKIDSVYSMGVPILTVSPHLNTLLEEKFNAETYYVGQIFNRGIFYPQRNAFKRMIRQLDGRSRVLIVGPFEGNYKNIPTMLRGISLAKETLKKALSLIRVSQYPLSHEEEQIIKPDEYHFHVPYAGMGNIYRSSDMLIALSTEAEGFGLPALEAMACGVPTILSRISSFLGFDDPQDYALFIDSNPEELSTAIQQMSEDGRLRERLSRRGLEVADKFTREALSKRLINAFESILSRA